MKTRRALTDEQERTGLEGLRILARIIARHALAHPDHRSPAVAATHRRPAAGQRLRKDGEA